MKKFKFNSLVIIVIIPILLLFFLILFYNQRIDINNGVGSFPSLNNTYDLSGEWEFYEEKYFSKDNSLTDPVYITFPENISSVRNHQGSYRIVLNGYDNSAESYLSLSKIYGYLRLYINKTPIYSGDAFLFDNTLIDKSIVGNSEYLEIIIELTNTEEINAFMGRAPIIGFSDSFSLRYTLLIVLTTFVMSGLLIISIITAINHDASNRKIVDTFLIIICLLSLIHIISINNSSFNFFNKITKFNLKTSIFVYIITFTLTTILIYIIFRLLSSNIKKYKPELFDIVFLIYILVIISLFFFIEINYFVSFIPAILSINMLIIFSTLLQTILTTSKHKFRSFLISSAVLLFICYLIDFLMNLNVLHINNFEVTPVLYLLLSLIYFSINTRLSIEKYSETKEVLALKEKIRDTEFTFLNSQIQSHFIYNTLNSIQALCYTSPNKAATLIEDFSSYLRTRLEFNKMPVLIDVMDELENIKTYLSIEKERFGKRVNYKFDLAVADFLVPPLSIQPLVENSVKHGISKKPGGGTVIIKTYENDDFIIIEVSDNGLGFNPSSLTEKQRVGTENIRHRLALHCNASLHIESNIGIGTKSIIKIPKSKQR